MHNDPLDLTTILQKLLYATNFNIQLFSQSLNQLKSQFFTQNPKQPSIVFHIIETLIIEQKFYDHLSLSYFNSTTINNHGSCQKQKDILYFGFQVIQELFSRPELVQNDNFVLTHLIKKCKLDVFLLIAICKGYLKNFSVRKDKVKSFFIQNFKKNTQNFVGLENFSLFHQALVEKSSQANYFTSDMTKRQRQYCKLAYFLDFYTTSRDFFPPTLQIDNTLIRMMISIKLDTAEDLSLYEKFQKDYIFENPYHLTTSCKNIRFFIQFFRNPFNQKTSQFYPQKSFIRLLAKYNKTQIEKIISFSQVGLAWSQDQISNTLANIFKLGLISTTFHLFQSLVQSWLKNGFADAVLRLAEIYIPKTFIFLKHENLFNISLAFLKEFSLGPKNPTKGIMNKILQKILIFAQKDCPLSKKPVIHEFMCLVQTKYEKVATLDDTLFINLKNSIKELRETKPESLPKDEEIQQRLNESEWQEIKVPLFGNNLGSNQTNQNQMVGKQSGEYKGLYNIGNCNFFINLACYMNSFLQCLYMNIEFRKCILDVSTLMLEKNVLQKLHQSSAKTQALQEKVKEIPQANKNIQLMARQFVRPTAELQRLFAQLTKSKRSAISPLTIKNVSSPEFKNTFQQDTIEFGRSFIDIISKSSLENIFQGQQTNQIICPVCQKSRFIKENFIDLMLTEVDEETQKMDEKSSITKESANEGMLIEKMVKKFFEPEQMQGLQCDFCHKKSQKSTKKHFISKFPNYLILTMKRFHYDVKANKNIKKHFNIDLRDGLMSLQGQLYQLYGIIVHRVFLFLNQGQSANSGHYFSFCREWKFENETQKQKDQKIVEEKVTQKMVDESVSQQQTFQKMEIQSEKSQLNSILNLKDFTQNKDRRWLCLNDSIVSVFESFQSVKEFLDLNQEDTPYVLFYEKVSHITSPSCRNLKEAIKLREPLEKFLEKDNLEYVKLMQSKRKGPQNNQKVDWKNFGKVKGFTAYDYFKFTRDDEDNGGSGNPFGGGGFGNNPIL